MRNKKVALFGGTFDPPHLGHLKMVEVALAKPEIEAVWVVPCFEHPFGKLMSPFEHRLEMCKLAFSSFEKRVRVLSVEKEFKGKSYTFRTLSHLKKKYPNLSFVLLVGKDVMQDVSKWYRYEDLKKEVEWFVLPRGKKSMIPDVSATSIRKRVCEGKAVGAFVPENVIEYILKNGLYEKSSMRRGT